MNDKAIKEDDIIRAIILESHVIDDYVKASVEARVSRVYDKEIENYLHGSITALIGITKSLLDEPSKTLVRKELDILADKLYWLIKK